MKNNPTILKGDLIVKGKKDSITMEEVSNNKIKIVAKKNASILVPPTTLDSLEIEVLDNVCLEITLTKCLNVTINAYSNSKTTISMIGIEKVSSNVVANLQASGASVYVETLIVANNEVIINQEIYHNASNTFSEISNYGVALDNGKIYFDTVGKINNKMNASNCRQLSKGLILGENGIVSSKPILLIDEFDVKAYHGASIGKMNEEDLFYLMSRGLSKNEAYALVLSGIINPFINKIEDEIIKEEYYQRINEMM